MPRAKTQRRKDFLGFCDRNAGNEALTVVGKVVTLVIKNVLRKALGQKAYNSISLVRRPALLKDIIGYQILCFKLLHSLANGRKASEKTSDICINKSHILMLAEKWDAGRPERGPSVTDWIFFGPLEASGLATYARLNRDEYKNKYTFDHKVMGTCLEKRPDLIFVTSWLLAGVQMQTLDVLKKALDIPVVVVWGDSVNHMEEAETLLPYIAFNVPLESPSYYLEVTKQPHKYLPNAFTALDPRIFYDSGAKRDIDVSFIGTMKDHPDRQAGIMALKQKGINVYQSGGQGEKRLSIEEYALIYKKSKMSLNFCYHPNGRVQVKGHVFEATSCGSMLMEAENPDTARYFEPMVDYVPFSDEKDLVEKVRYYLAHDEEREAIAANGYRKVREKFNCEAFWGAVLEKAIGGGHNNCESCL